jgi:agmatinase
MQLFTQPGKPFMRDPGDERVLDLMVQEGDIILTGVPWDWSITGRPGSRFAPSRIRSYLYSLTTFSTDKGKLNCRIQDAGDINIAPGDRESSFKRIKTAASQLFSSGKPVIFLGGDHSITGPILEALLDKGSVGLIFLDAHYDMRSLKEGMSSGTWLWDLYSKPAGKRLKVVLIGVQDYANPSYLEDRAKKAGVTVVSFSTLMEKGVESAFSAVDSLMELNLDYYYLSVDIDHLDQAYAPGVNAPSPIGMNPRESLAIIKHVINKLKPLGVDFTEVSPLVDIGDMTSRLVARLALEAIHSLCLVSGNEGKS